MGKLFFIFVIAAVVAIIAKTFPRRRNGASGDARSFGTGSSTAGIDQDDLDDDYDDYEDYLYVGGKRYRPDKPRRPEWRPNRIRLHGKWRQITGSIEVSGIAYRKRDAQAFIAAAKAAEKAGEAFSVNPLRAPDNPHDANAIELWGKVGNERWMIGFVPASTAKSIAETFPRDMALAAELYKVVENGPYIDIYVILLGPSARDVFWSDKVDPLRKK